MPRPSHRLRAVAAAIWLLATAATPGLAHDIPCTIPDGLAFGDFPLPESRAQISEGKRLVVLVVGGASITSTAAGGRAYSLPARLEARLHVDLPGQHITVVSRDIQGGDTRIAANRMAANIRETGAKLVVWATGAGAAAFGDDLEMFGTNLEFGINAAKNAKADIILMDLQYAPSIARVMNQTPYSYTIRGSAEMADIPMLPRYELMRAWSYSGELDFDTDSTTERLKVARKLYDCLAAILAGGIVGALP